MNEPLKPGKNNPAQTESPEHLRRSVQREQTILTRTVEEDLDGSLAPFRVGSVRYLNAVPLTRGLEDQIQFATPSELAILLQQNKLDAALVSITEVLFHDRYDVLDGIGVASLGEVRSVFLAHRTPIEQLTVVHCDPASLTSVNLLRVLLAERGLKAELRPLPNYAQASELDAVLLIGDPAIHFALAPHQHQIWDLGAAWQELTQLPFVYAVWALRRELDHRALRSHLREAKNFGLETIDHIIQSRTDFTAEFRRDYLTWHIHYHLGTDEKRGITRFIELLRQHFPEPVFDPRYVS